MPIWVPHGTRGAFQDMSKLGEMSPRANWHVKSYDTGALPHFEKPLAFMADFKRFLGSVDAGGGRASP
jgi:hypothetical protein